MHPSILGAGLLASALACGAVQAACPGPGAPVAELFIPADCPACWAQASGARPGWRFDWVRPAAVDAALAATALPEADDRARRAGLGPSSAGQVQPLRRTLARARPGLSMQVQSGPAWQGYFGVQLLLRTPARPVWPAGTTAWLALVELLPAGSEGNPESRALVRNVAGPLPLADARPGQTLNPLRAMRWPETAQPERLQARAWLEAPDGQVLAVVADRCD